MIEVIGDIWEKHKSGAWACVTTNGEVNSHGACVMGRGVAKDAAIKFQALPFELGRAIQELGNVVMFWPQYRIITFPVKHHWREPADPELIRQSCLMLRSLLKLYGERVNIYLPKPGCGNGGLRYEATVKPILLETMSDVKNLCVIDRR